MESAVTLPEPPPTIAAKPPLHPPYKEMILTAVVSLNERGGSSSRAISKFIKSKYTNLSKKHDALLLCHLHRLRTKGALKMLRHSYKLSPRLKLNLAPSAVTSKPRGRPKKVPETSQLSSVLSGKLVLRGPGRPPKALAVKRGPGRPPSILKVKRGPGRPPKSLSDERGAGRPSQVAVKRGPGRPPNIMAAKKIPGRPPKSMAVKKGPGRPPKSLVAKKGPGRPPKSLSPKKGPGRPPKSSAIGTGMVPSSGAGKRGRPPKSEKKGPGRPRKEPGLGDPVQSGEKRKSPDLPREVENGVPPDSAEKKSEKKGPGRPRKEPGPGVPLQSGVKRKSPGRPRKVENGVPPDSAEKKKGRGRPKKVEVAPAESSEKKAPASPAKEGNDVVVVPPQ